MGLAWNAWAHLDLTSQKGSFLEKALCRHPWKYHWECQTLNTSPSWHWSRARFCHLLLLAQKADGSEGMVRHPPFSHHGTPQSPSQCLKSWSETWDKGLE